MTDETNPIGNRSERFARFIAERDSEGSAAMPMPVSASSVVPALRYHSATDEFEDLNTGSRVPASAIAQTEGATDEVISDDGRNIEFHREEVMRPVRSMKEQLEAFDFDPATGAKRWKISGSERDELGKRLISAMESADYDLGKLNALQAQRDRIASERAAHGDRDFQREQRITRMEQEELERIEARERAEAKYQARRRG